MGLVERDYQRLAQRQSKWRRFARPAALILGALAAAVVGAVLIESHDAGRKTTAVQRLGQPVKLHDSRVTVVYARTARQLHGVKPVGVFVVVALKVKNVGNEPGGPSLTPTVLVSGNGKIYSQARISEGLGYVRLQPDFSTRGWMAFDVTPAAARGAHVRFEDCKLDPTSDKLAESCDRAEVDLGLRRRTA